MFASLSRSSGDRPLRPTFGPTSGAITGVIGIVCGLFMVVVALVHGVEASEWVFIAGGLFIIAVSWSVLLRPRVILEADEIVLRNMVSDHRVPYAQVEEFLIRSTTVVVAGGRRYRGIGVGRTRRQMAGIQRAAGGQSSRMRRLVPDTEPTRHPGAGHTEADQLEDQVAERVQNAVPGEASVRRVPAPFEITALVITAVALVLTFVL